MYFNRIINDKAVFMTISLNKVLQEIYPLTSLWNSISNGLNGAIRGEQDIKNTVLICDTNEEILKKQQALQADLAELRAVQNEANLDIQLYRLQKQRELELELKRLDVLLAREIALYNRETAILAIQEQKRLDNSPILILAEDILRQANFNEPLQPLRIFLSPPINHNNYTQNTDDQNIAHFPINQETLESYLRNFLEKYTQTGRPISFQGGAWQSNLFRAETATHNLFLRLKPVPTLVLDSEAPNRYFQLRLGFWSGNFDQLRYKSIINDLPWQEILYSFAKIRAKNWLIEIQTRMQHGETEASIYEEYSQVTLKNYHHNLQILEREAKYLARGGKDVSRMDDRNYQINSSDYEDFAKFIGLCHQLIAGLIADEYFLIHVPVEVRQMPLLPTLLPAMFESMPILEETPLIEIMVNFYNNLYDTFLEKNESAWLADLRLRLAECLLVLSDKQWAVDQIRASVKSWLTLRNIEVDGESLAKLLAIMYMYLTIDDQEYVSKLNYCLLETLQVQQLSIIDACWQRGMSHLDNLVYELAINEFSQVLELDSDRTMANYYRGVAYVNISQYELAFADFSHVLKTVSDQEEEVNGVVFEMVFIPAGKFLMGAYPGELGASNDEYPQHYVRIETPFYMSKYAITQAQYKAITNTNPSYFRGDRYPVERVSWEMAEAYCHELSKKTGKTYRLPSEAEWEYAARANTTTNFHFGKNWTEKLANCSYSISATTDVGTYPPNAFGLYDMHGNVSEWCADDWHENYHNAPADGSAWLNPPSDGKDKVFRGGSWHDLPDNCRVAERSHNIPANLQHIVGFRICRSAS
jgi:formylglycine-generating enzyme required for sulfatase activity